MEKIKNNYEEEIKLIQLFQDSLFQGLEFYNNFEIKNDNKYIIKKSNYEIAENLKIICKEIIYKKWIEKYIEINLRENDNNFEIYKIIVNNERIKLILEKIVNGKTKIISKQFDFNGHLIYKYEDNKNNYILNQNINTMLFYLENFKDKLNCNVFKLENEKFEYITKLPYNLVYEAINYCIINNENELIKLYEEENKKRKAINSKEIKIRKETQKSIEKNLEKMSLVYENSKNIYDYMINILLNNSNINSILEKGTYILNNNKNEEKETIKKENVEIEEISDLELLKKQRKELIELKLVSDEMIEKLQNILIN